MSLALTTGKRCALFAAVWCGVVWCGCSCSCSWLTCPRAPNSRLKNLKPSTATLSAAARHIGHRWRGLLSAAAAPHPVAPRLRRRHLTKKTTQQLSVRGPFVCFLPRVVVVVSMPSTAARVFVSNLPLQRARSHHTEIPACRRRRQMQTKRTNCRRHQRVPQLALALDPSPPRGRPPRRLWCHPSL